MASPVIFLAEGYLETPAAGVFYLSFSDPVGELPAILSFLVFTIAVLVVLFL
jgi:hypothetical protein